jgi:pyruvate ferredoxin oxidoreductase gamma subunit/2-oxoisovalerate ferredoxin oxidoreductase gamma subunit
MVEIRIHGRGGQGSVIASKLLASAAHKDGLYAQSFPAFGVERRGAPVLAFTRIDKEYVNLRCEIYKPDHVVVLDPTLLLSIDVTSGLKEGGSVLINSPERPPYFGLSDSFHVATVDANAIAVEKGLGSKTAPIINTAILGAFAKLTGIVSLEAIRKAIVEGAPVKKEENALAAKIAYESVVV